MGENVLSYASDIRPRPSRAATASIWLGATAHLLPLTCLIILYFVDPETIKWPMTWYQQVNWFKFVPAFFATVVAIVGVVVALIGLARPARLRRRAIIGLMLCLAVFGWWFV